MVQLETYRAERPIEKAAGGAIHTILSESSTLCCPGYTLHIGSGRDFKCGGKCHRAQQSRMQHEVWLPGFTRVCGSLHEVLESKRSLLLHDQLGPSMCLSRAGLPMSPSRMRQTCTEGSRTGVVEGVPTLAFSVPSNAGACAGHLFCAAGICAQEGEEERRWAVRGLCWRRSPPRSTGSICPPRGCASARVLEQRGQHISRHGQSCIFSHPSGKQQQQRLSDRPIRALWLAG